MNARTTVCLLGFGEVGQTLAADLAERGVRSLRAWDVLFPSPQSPPSLAAASSRTVTAAPDLRGAASDAEIVISAVTAAQCVAAARAASAHLGEGAWYIDLNSVSPATKVAAADFVTKAGGRYVESAVMAPIGPKRIATPMLLGGPHAREFLPVARELGFAGASVYADELGRASAAKMCRSIIVKGMEALLGESLLTARRYGVEGTVLESLRDLFPGADWQELGRYMISRSLQHGKRRAEEMREVAVTASEAGVEPLMSSAIAGRQDWAAQFAEAAHVGPLTRLLDAVLDSMPGTAGARTEASRSC
jgi:3-hydroxyisobutyrate dehydrogenase-like beta-hydroxyacid dehydrogenase